MYELYAAEKKKYNIKQENIDLFLQDIKEAVKSEEERTRETGIYLTIRPELITRLDDFNEEHKKSIRDLSEKIQELISPSNPIQGNFNSRQEHLDWLDKAQHQINQILEEHIKKDITRTRGDFFGRGFSENMNYISSKFYEIMELQVPIEIKPFPMEFPDFPTHKTLATLTKMKGILDAQFSFKIRDNQVYLETGIRNFNPHVLYRIGERYCNSMPLENFAK